MVFQRHPVYLITHLLFGFIGYFYPQVLYVTIGYQVFQYMFNVRFFVFEMKLKTGNSLEHTAIKLGEVAMGYFIAMLYKALSTA
jgi:hypothetical protein